MNFFELDGVSLQEFKKYLPNVGYLSGQISERIETGKTKQKHLTLQRSDSLKRTQSPGPGYFSWPVLRPLQQAGARTTVLHLGFVFARTEHWFHL